MILHRKKQNTFDKKRRFGTASRRFFIHFAYVRVKFVSRSFCRRRPPRTENFARGNNISSRPTFSRVVTRFCFALFRFAMTETSLGRTSFHVTGPWKAYVDGVTQSVHSFLLIFLRERRDLSHLFTTMRPRRVQYRTRRREGGNTRR